MLILLAFLIACTGAPTSTDTGSISCGHGTHLDNGECVVDADRDTGGDSGDTGTQDSGDTAVPVTPEYCGDYDGDGFLDQTACFGNDQGNPAFYQLVADPSVEPWDCDDEDAYTFPGAANFDSDTACETDADGDGWGSAVPVAAAASGTDCDDGNSGINPSVLEVQGDGDDNTCDGQIDEPVEVTECWDEDGDGYGGELCLTADPAIFDSEWTDVTGDCDDTDPSVTVGDYYYDDTDGDGYGDIAVLSGPSCSAPAGYVAINETMPMDCDPTRSDVHPGAEPLCELGVDANCDGSDDTTDGDGDGLAACEGDCDDTNPAINPSAAEVCNGADDDCNGTIDVGATDAPDWYSDLDGDSYGNVANVITQCTVPAGYVGNATDCNDASTGINPGASEVCDGVDNDCDGSIDDADSSVSGQSVWFKDADGDGYGDTASAKLACSAPAGYVANATDCDDSNGAYHPGAATVCELGVDANCDGSDDTVDGDGDGYAACEECNDADASINPGALEVCNGVDDDCDGSVDEGAVDAPTWYQDADSDTYGNAGVNVSQCDQPAGYVGNKTDCNDASTGINPGASEVCDGVDNNCDGVTDTDAIDQSTWYYDADGDGYGGTDTDDSNNTVH